MKRFLGSPVLTGLLIALALLASAGANISMAQANTLSPGMLAIQGHWIRTDAPYVLELTHAKDGSLQTAYYNPKPINVGKTETAEENGTVQLLVELQDVNYPGSTYILSFNRQQDQLQGIYFHPETQQSYEVTFVRQVTK
ncbi:MAG: hypothetical protein OET90_06030 [Desulfuromonadales bacterium]|nr:hypothetical protein [Desulfuromonadales bacterium]